MYRYDLENLKGKNFIVEGKIAARGLKHVDSQFGGYKLKTVCLEDIKCGIKMEGKIKLLTKLHHIWFTEDTSFIVKDKELVKGDVVRLMCTVYEYQYSHGMQQLGLKQIKGTKHIKRNIQ